jgi:hypothetical protein
MPGGAAGVTALQGATWNSPARNDSGLPDASNVEQANHHDGVSIMAATQSTLTALLEDANYAAYLVSMHFKSHQKRPGSGYGCRTCQDLDADLERAEAAVTAFVAKEEAAA